MGRFRLELLSDSGLDLIHKSSLRVLSKTGVLVDSHRAREILMDAGCVEASRANVILIPSDLVEEAIRKAPRKVRLASRNGKHDLEIPDGRSHVTTDGCGVNVVDRKSRERRRSTAQDLADLTQVADALSCAEVQWPMVSASDSPEPVHGIVEFLTTFRFTAKHVQHEALSAEEAEEQIRLASIILGRKETLERRPIMSSVQCPVSPLHLEAGSTEAALVFADHAVPVVPISMALLGASSPVNPASGLVISNAENLAMITLLQLAHPGSPMIYSISSGPIDMRSGAFACGSPELAILSVAGAGIASHYELPCLVSGFVSDSTLPSVQAGFEKMATGVFSLLAGADLISGVGALETDNCMSVAQLVLDSEIAEHAMRTAEGIQFTEDDLGIDLIERVGPASSFLKERDTLRNFRKALWMPKLSDRLSYDAWSASGSKDIVEKAWKEAEDILTHHNPEPIDEDILKELLVEYENYSKRVLKAQAR